MQQDTTKLISENSHLKEQKGANQKPKAVSEGGKLVFFKTFIWAFLRTGKRWLKKQKKKEASPYLKLKSYDEKS